jgi:hypothetical protein
MTISVAFSVMPALLLPQPPRAASPVFAPCCFLGLGDGSSGHLASLSLCERLDS